MLDTIQEPLPGHFAAWQENSTDKLRHPLFIVASGPGTGKSRLLQEFPALLDNLKLSEELMERIQQRFVFHVGFENGTPYDPNFDTNVTFSIGRRMLFQLRADNIDWISFCQTPHAQVSPDQVVARLADLLSQQVDQLTIVLLIDGLQKLPHELRSKISQFYASFSCLSQLVNAGRAFFICCAATTIDMPIRDVLADSPQVRVYLSPTILDGKKVIQCDGNFLLEILVDDMGGHGRALEALAAALESTSLETCPLSNFVALILDCLMKFYPTWTYAQSPLLLPCLKIILGNIKVSPSSVITTTDSLGTVRTYTVDEIRSMGLIRLEVDKLVAPFIWVYLLANYSPNISPALKSLIYGTYEKIEVEINNGYYALEWQHWESFNALFRVLKSELLAGPEVKLSQLHAGASLNLSPNLPDSLIVSPLKLEYASFHCATSSDSLIDEIKTESGMAKVSSCDTFFINAPSAPYGGN